MKNNVSAISESNMSSTKPQDIAIADYDYDLPDERIARYPLSERSSSKLLVYRSGEISTHTFRDLPDLLPEGSLIVRNNSKVIRARLIFHKDSGARIEIFCLDPALPESYELSLSSTQGCSWHCMLGNAKRFVVRKRGRYPSPGIMSPIPSVNYWS